MKSYTAGKNEENLRLLRFCEKVCPSMPKSMLHKAFRNKRIKINGKKQDADYRLKEGDLIELYINDEFFADKKTIAATDFTSLKILYEDDNILLAIKPFGLLCHSDNKNEPNLIDMILSYLRYKGEFEPDKENSFTPALCNRIDQGTEGIVIAAKNYTSLVDMNSLIKNNLLNKSYLCVTEKSIKDGEYKAFLKRDKTAKKVTVTPTKASDEYKEIITQFRTLKRKSSYNLIECTLITGRTHQIRAHLAFLGRPIIGDRKYGTNHKKLDSQLLCAYRLSFGKIPESSSVAYLTGRSFTYEENSVISFFNEIREV